MSVIPAAVAAGIDVFARIMLKYKNVDGRKYANMKGKVGKYDISGWR